MWHSAWAKLQLLVYISGLPCVMTYGSHQNTHNGKSFQDIFDCKYM